MDDELLSLKWNNHQSTFLRIISNLRTKDAYVDATLACNGRFYSVHRFVLSSCSAYFSSIFDQVASKNIVIVLKDITCSTLEYLLDYMYNGEINVRQNELASLVKAAECLRIKGLAVADDVDTYTPYKSSKRLETHCSFDGNKKARSQKGMSEHQNLNANESDYKINKQCLSDLNKCYPNLSNSTQLRNFNDNSMCEKENLLEKVVKHEPDEKLKLLEDCEWSNSNVLNYKEENTIIQNLTTSEMTMLENEDVSIRNPGSSSTLNVKLQWESDHPSGSALESNVSIFSDCLAAIQELPDSLNDEFVLPSNEIYHGNSELLFQSAIDGYRRKSPYGKFVNKGDNVMKSYKCKHCSYSCHDASNFKRHMQTHTGEKPYKCSFCNYRCIHSSNLKCHIRYKHA